MNINTKDIRIDKIPAGAYYIGDPCYAFTKDHQQWLRLLNEADYFEKPMVEFAWVHSSNCEYPED